MEKFDIVVIGSGSGGYPAAIRAAQLGASVALIEKETLGGTCLNRGCIPTKTLIASSDLFVRMKRSKELGLTAGKLSFDYAAISKRKDEVVTVVTSGLAQLLKGNGIKIFNGTGSFVGRNRIAIEGIQGAQKKADSTFEAIVEARNTVIATGSEPIVPGFLPKSRRIIDSRAFLNLTELPSSMIVFGGGVIGCEFACIAAQLGVKVTVVKRREIFPDLDSEIRREVKRRMENELGIVLLTGKGKSMKNVKAGRDGVSGTFMDEPVEAELMLVTVGRRPVTKGLALENAGLQTGEGGCIETDKSCRTRAATIYAVGDVTGGPQFAYTATSQGIIAAENACGANRRQVETVVPLCIFTSPEIGTVGITEDDAKEQGINVKTGRYRFAALGRAAAVGETKGFVKWVADADTGQLLGGHAVGWHATDLICEATTAIRAELTAEEVARTLHGHPTFSEAWMEAAHAVCGTCIHQPPRREK